jgi:cyclophilin family peptidyl-prolyl cis-trans isomerase
MIQGGDPLTKEPNQEAKWGTGDPGCKIKAEFNDRTPTRGVVSMARSQDPDSAGSQVSLSRLNHRTGEEALAHLLSLMRVGWAAKEQGL